MRSLSLRHTLLVALATGTVASISLTAPPGHALPRPPKPAAPPPPPPPPTSLPSPPPPPKLPDPPPGSIRIDDPNRSSGTGTGTGRPAARLGDMHVCPMVNGLVPHVGGAVFAASPNVFIGGLPAARADDPLVCVGPPDAALRGSGSVRINGRPALRAGDLSAHGGSIVSGFPVVLVGD